MMTEDVDRYQKILEDWSWSAKSKKGGGAPPSRERLTPSQARPTGKVQYQQGAILLLNGRTIAVYKQPIPSKEYDLMLVLFPGNVVKTQGIATEGHQVEELGMLPNDIMDRIGRELRWNRDMIVFHCYSFDDVQKVPEHMAPPAAAATPENPIAGIEPLPASVTEQSAGRVAVVESVPVTAPPSGGMRRGQRLQVKFGDKAWFAVFWGKDAQGQVVAHKTNRDWSLMHLDLDRFGTDLQVDPNVDADVIGEIEASLGRA